MSHRALLPLLLPPGSYDPRGRRLAAELAAEAAIWDAAQSSADRLVESVTPFEAGDLLIDWERVLGISAAPDAGYQLRLQDVLAKLRERGGLAIPYFVQLAATLGYAIEIDEPQPFRAGVNRAGDRLQIEEIIWTWVVSVRGQGTRPVAFRAGTSSAGERLLAFGDPVIEAIISDLKPAWSHVSFQYPDLETPE